MDVLTNNHHRLNPVVVFRCAERMTEKLVIKIKMQFNNLLYRLHKFSSAVFCLDFPFFRPCVV
jgi:hypothetical protein